MSKRPPEPTITEYDVNAAYRVKDTIEAQLDFIANDDDREAMQATLADAKAVYEKLVRIASWHHHYGRKERAT